MVSHFAQGIGQSETRCRAMWVGGGGDNDSQISPIGSIVFGSSKFRYYSRTNCDVSNSAFTIIVVIHRLKLDLHVIF